MNLPGIALKCICPMCSEEYFERGKYFSKDNSWRFEDGSIWGYKVQIYNQMSPQCKLFRNCTKPKPFLTPNHKQIPGVCYTPWSFDWNWNKNQVTMIQIITDNITDNKVISSVRYGGGPFMMWSYKKFITFQTSLPIILQLTNMNGSIQ